MRKILVAGSIALGIALLLTSEPTVQGQISGQGSTLPSSRVITEGTIVHEALLKPMTHASAPIRQKDTAAGTATIIIGMCLIASGLLLHALFVLYSSKDRRVPVHSIERSRTTIEREARAQRSIEVYWVEQVIRL